jgi:hypothetical protein
MIPFNGVCRASEMRVRHTARDLVSIIIRFALKDSLYGRSKIKAISTCSTRADARAMAKVTPNVARGPVRLS